MKKFASQFVNKSPLSKLKKKIVGQDTGEIKTDKKGEYVMHGKDTIRPANNKNFRPFIKGKQSGKMSSGYLSDDDYTVKDGIKETVFKAGLDLTLPADLNDIQEAINEVNKASQF